jgi:signal transduction histidine kinase/ligand-binding sensor domain-containing protein
MDHGIDDHRGRWEVQERMTKCQHDSEVLIIQASRLEHSLTVLRMARYGVMAVIWIIFMMTLAFPALALDSHRIADDYIRADFTVEDGLPDNVINAIVQTENGLLWVGTESGLASFNGRDFATIDLSAAGAPPQGAVHSLLQSSVGDLWVGTDAGVVLIPRSALDQFSPSLVTFYHPGSGPSNEVSELAESRDGVIWAGTSHGLYRREAGKFMQVIPAVSVSRIAEASNGHLLLVTDQGYIEWDGHRILRHPGLAAGLGVHEDQIFEVFQDRGGTMWYCTDRGITRNDDQRRAPLEPSNVAKTPAFRIYQDYQGTLWIAGGMGIYRVDGDRLDTPVPGLHARSFCASRDGELWIGTNGSGLVHLRRRVVRMFTKADGLPNDMAMTVLSAHDGRLWVGNICGLSVLDGKNFKNYNEKDGLLNSCVWALAEDAKDNLWVGTYGGGLFRFRDGHFVQYSIEQGLVSRIVLQIVAAHDDSLWITTPNGISHMQDGRIRNYTIADGLSSNQILSIHLDRAGTLLAATQGGLDRLVGERFVPFPSNQPEDNPLFVRFSEDSLGNLYTAASPKGISLVANNRLIIANEDLKLLDMAESPQHDLWFTGKNGIIRIGRDSLISAVWNHDGPLDYRVFDRSDGMNSVQCSAGSPNIALAPDGKLWVATVKGLAMVDLTQVPRAARRPKIFVGAITVGKQKELAGPELILPPGTHHVELHLEAVDLASPEKVRLQYRLDGVDAGWLDADASRMAVYTNIPVGADRFHVRASASDGVWDRTGIVYNITQRPYFYQTTWFRVVAISAFILLLSAAYLMRVQQIVQQAHIRLEERLVERERIARELHDTLLQGVLSASMQLDVAEDQLPEDSPTKPLLRRALQMMRQVVEEGRNALRGLRTQDADNGDLALAFSRIGRELAVDERIGYRVVAQTAMRPLRAQIRDEVYRIGREAIVNAFMHANASSVEVEMEHANRYFRILVRDDGCGIDSQVLDAGREGHWGLAGMRERSEGMGASLKLRSRPGTGTEVELTIPGAIAFETFPNGPISRWLPWLSRERFETTPNGKKKRG